MLALDVDKEDRDAQFWLCLALFEDGKLVESDAVLRDLRRDLPYSSPLYLETVYLLVTVQLQRNDVAGARSVLDALPPELSNEIDAVVLAAQVTMLEGNRSHAEAMLLEIQHMLSPETDWVTRYRLADILYSSNRFAEAARQLEEIVDIRVDSEPTRRLLSCYYRSGDLNSALEVCKALRDEYGLLQYTTQIEISIREETDDLTSASQLCEEYLQLHPDDLTIEIQQAAINYRLKRFDAVDTFLDGDISIVGLSSASSYRLTELFLRRRYYREALGSTYETRRRFLDEAQAHMLYVHTFFALPEDARSWLDLEEARVGAAICITEESEDTCIVIDDRDDVDITRGEFPPEHPYVKRLLGKKIRRVGFDTDGPW